jgi:hypothetical protein
MNLHHFSGGITDWSKLPATQHSGESGHLTVRSRQLGDIQLRHIVYSANYVADHWCHKGHLVFVLAGQLVIEHQDELRYTLAPGITYHVADNDGLPHRVVSKEGATVLVVD